MKKIVVLLVIILSLLTCGLASASDVSGANYIGIIRASNNSTAAAVVSLPVNGANSTSFIDGNFLNSGANNSVLRYSGSDIPFCWDYSTEQLLMYISSIGQNSLENYSLYFGGSGGDHNIFGTVAVTDDPSIEITDNGAAEMTGVQLTQDATIFEKEDAIDSVYDITTENVTAGIYESIGYYEADSASGWTDNANAIDGATGTYAYAVLPSGGTSAYITLTIEEFETAKLRYYWSYSSRDPESMKIDIYDGSWTNIYNGAPGAINTWIEKTFTSANITRVRFNFTDVEDTGDGEVRLHEAPLYGRTTAYIASVTATGVEQGEHDIEVEYNNPWLSLGIDISSLPITPNSDDVELNAPLWQAECSSSPFTSIDDNGVALTVSGATWTSSGYSFDGINDVIDVDDTLLQDDDTGAISIWFKANNTTGTEQIFDISNGANTTVTELQIGLNYDAGTPQRGIFVHVYVSDIAQWRWDILKSVYNPASDHEWHNITISHNGTNPTIKLDDVAVGSYLTSTNTTVWIKDLYDSPNPPNTCTIGARYTNSTYSAWFEKYIGQVVIWDNSLTAAEITRFIDATENKFGGSSDIFTYSSAVSVPDTANDWTFGSDNISYFESLNIAVGGVDKCSINWEYAATLTDDSGNGNDGTLTPRTTSSDPDVSAELIEFYPIAEADAPAYTINASAYSFITGNISTSSTFTTTPSTGFDFLAVIQDVASESNTPYQLPLLLGALFTILVISFGVTYMLRQHQAASTMAQVIIIVVLMGIGKALGVFDTWMIILFVPIGLGCSMASGTTFQGTGNTGNNMFGFLTMNFIGWTVINNILAGKIMQSGDLAVVDNFLAFQPFSVFGWFTIPVPNVSFLTNGLPALMNWDEYTFLAGNAQFVTYLMYSITAIVSFMLFVLAIGAVYQLFSRGR